MLAEVSTQNGFVIKQSEARLGVVATVSAGGATFSDSGIIHYQFNSSGEAPVSLFLAPLHPHAQHLCRVEMTDSNGMALKPKKAAAALNRTYITETNLFLASDLQKVREWKRLTPYTALPRRDGGVAYKFYSPNDLFIIEKPGSYTLSMEFQVFKPAKATNPWPLSVVSFPAIEIPITIKAATNSPRSSN